jgi:glutamyl/glutaminyl-tRNA synthetase
MPKQLLLYQFFKWEPPRFAHLPLVLGMDHAPLSKRHGDTSLRMYREHGYLPESLNTRNLDPALKSRVLLSPEERSAA